MKDKGQPTPLELRCLQVLRRGPLHFRQVARILGISDLSTNSHLVHLWKKGLVIKLGKPRGMYGPKR